MARYGHKHGGGRPTVMTADVLGKLEDAFTNAFSDEMACLYAGINPDTLYEYCKANPKFSERKELLKGSPNLHAQKKLVEDAKATVGGARWWAEHKMPDFMPKSKVELGGKVQTEAIGGSDASRELVRKYEDEYRTLIAEEAKNTP